MRRLCICLMAMALVVLPAWADGPETGIVEGNVTDAQNDALPGVLITLVGDRGSKNAVSGEDGGFRFALLVPGSYLLQAVLEASKASNRLSTSVPARNRSFRFN